MKFTIIQKKLGSPISKELLAKLTKEKSDFLLLPQKVFYKPNENPETFMSRYQSDIDSLLDLSVSYPGAIIGGTLYSNSSQKINEETPIIKEMSVIDRFERGDSPNKEIAFIVSGIRFSFLIGRDSENKSILDSISEKKVSFVFCLDSEPSLRTYEEDLEFFSQLASSRKWNLFRVCGFHDDPFLAGRSLFATPSGIQWKVGKLEENKEIMKTIHFNITNPFL